MSECQYFEFQAVDRCLTDEEMSELRTFSSRASITSNSFVNEYSYGDFRGDEDAWMEKYFDGFLYYANCGTHILKLKVPLEFLDFTTVEPYCIDDAVTASVCEDSIILNFRSENEGGEGWEEARELASFLALRTDLIRGDLRCLYLGWLSALENCECDEKSHEPTVPAGLAQLSPALRELSDFLRIDPSLIEVASKRSVSVEKRTISDLLNEAERTAQEHERIAAERIAAERAKKQRLQILAREKRLNEIRGQEGAIWDKIEFLVSEKKASSYDKAIELLIDLRDLARRGNFREFIEQFAKLKQRHFSKSAFQARLKTIDLGTVPHTTR